MKLSEDKDSAVYSLSRASRCYGCDTALAENQIVKLKDKGEEREVLCLSCSGLEAFDLLPSGNAQATRLAKKYSKVYFVVLKWSDLWKAYERRGLLLEKQAISRALSELAR